MLEESSNQLNDYVDFSARKAQPTIDPKLQSLRDVVGQVMMIQQENAPQAPQVVVQYAGPVVVPSDEVIPTLDPHLEKLDVHAYFTASEEPDRYVITVLDGRHRPQPRPWWPNALMFVLTVLSMLFVGAQIQAGSDGRELNDLADIRLWEGWPYALSLILILGAHELGHYFAARRHDVDVTLPYFIPFPIGVFGTLGAFIQLREPMPNRKVLFDIGVAGPLVGLIFAIPILFYGLATSNIEVIPQGETFIREGNSILYALAKIITFGRYVPDGNEDVLINQFAQAGWTGLFVTALNLVPVGQLDGGHIIYTLIGRRAQQLFWPAIIVLSILTFTVNSAWFLWTLLLFFFGRVHAVPLDDVTPLGMRRRMLAILALIIFVLIFIPNPIEFIEGT